jgi:hypothetical protein
MGTVDLPRVRCPDCGKAVGPLARELVCQGCGRRFAAEGGVWDLLPASRDAVKVNEDRAHVEAGLPTWRRLFMHKRYWLEWCDADWLPTIVDRRTRSFLEIGGGLCYASALAKAKAPGAHVVATDVSARYLRHHAVSVGRILGASADVYAAADAETLPFEDSQFDRSTRRSSHRCPVPRGRCAAAGARRPYLGIDALPWAGPHARGADHRARAGGTRATDPPEWVSIWSSGLEKEQL